MKEIQISLLVPLSVEKANMAKHLMHLSKKIAFLLCALFSSFNFSFASPVSVSYDILSNQFIDSTQTTTLPFSEPLNDFCLARLLLEAVEKKKLKFNEEFLVSSEILSSSGKQPKKIILQPGKNISVRDLLRALILIQSNEASIIAKHVLERLNPSSKNAQSCFEEKKDIEIKKLLEDISYLVENIPDDVLSFTDTSTEIQGVTFPTYLKVSRSEKTILSFLLEKKSIVIGLAFISNGRNKDNPRIVVSLCYNHEDPSSLLPSITRNLINAVNNYETVKVIEKNKPLTIIPIIDGQSPSVALAPKNTFYLTLPREDLTKKDKKLEFLVERKELIKAPVFTNVSVARVNICLDGRVLKSVALYPMSNVEEKKTALSRIYRAFKHFFGKIYG